MELPGSYLEEMRGLLKDDFAAYLASLQQPATTALRVNTAKITVEDFVARSPFPLEPVPWCPEGFYYPPSRQPAQHPYYFAGLYYLQEPSAMAPAVLAAVAPDDLVLDACGAPGGKATQLAARLTGGVLLTNDVSVSRQHATLRNVERSGLTHCAVTAEDTARLRRHFPETFDRILADVPCSGEGMFRKDPAMIRNWQHQEAGRYPALQRRILQDCAAMLKPGGTLLYSTCTFSRAENEDVVSAVLNEDPALSAVPLSGPGFAPGLDPLPQAVRLYPFRLAGEGHFAALLQKQGKPAAAKPSRCDPPFTDDQLEAFLAQIARPIPRAEITLRNDQVLWIPRRMPDTAGLRVLRSGLLLGTMQHGRFVPAQPLAMALKRSEFVRSVSWEAEDPACRRYLRGESLACPEAEDGWTLVCVDDYPLGWGKVSGGRLKNHLDPGWRTNG
jgi:16S rRNA C967 or C1407 C5-methylase (RsmB/RsmF family)/NOL1/NOP2/fmu family ribosome biogenesis protein